MNKKFVRIAAVLVLALATSQPWAQDISDQVKAQIATIRAAKASLTPAQQKLQTGLAYTAMANANDPRTASVRALFATDGPVKVAIRGDVSDSLVAAVAQADGVISYQSTKWGVIYATLPTSSLEALAARPDVQSIRRPARSKTNVGAVTSQGYISHNANGAVAAGWTGNGVKVGVLSDSASQAEITTLIGTGDLPAGTTFLPGQSGAPGTDEGTAMMEIVHDVAPGASLVFATAFESPESFADNIIALAAAGAKVIVDDVSWSDEGVFQDTVIAKAVNQVTTSNDVVYFSSAGNSGNLTRGNSTVYEGDYLSGGNPGGPLAGANVHNFGTPGSPVLYNALLQLTDVVTLQWSDPWNVAPNDYDLYVLNAAGTTILGASTDIQDGQPGSNPDEEVFGANYPAGSRIYVDLFAGSARALHLSTFGNASMTYASPGATSGHNAGKNTMSTAAVAWNSAKNGTIPYSGGSSNPTETFSSDGPRKIFYQPDGTPITPGNFLFATNGGETLQKPDIAAADGGSTLTPGFNPFFGTSAAAPHAAAIAALIRQARPDYTQAQVKTAMIQSALAIMGTAPNRDAGYGVTMALAAVQYALAH